MGVELIIYHLRFCRSSAPSKLPEQIFPDAASCPVKSLSRDHTRPGSRSSDTPLFNTCTMPLTLLSMHSFVEAGFSKYKQTALLGQSYGLALCQRM